MMVAPPGLPQIVDNKRTLAGDIGKIDHVQVEDLQTLWKVYTTNKNVIQTGRRLENLFWRIWGSERLRKNISGRTVAAIFMFISEGEGAVKDPALRIRPYKQRSAPKRSQSIIECPPTPPPSPARVPGGLSPTEFFEFQPSQTALSASILQALPNTPPSPPGLPKVPPPSPASPGVHRPILTRNHQSYPQTVLQQKQDAAFGNQRMRGSRARGPKKRTTFAANTKPGGPAESKGLIGENRSPLSKVQRPGSSDSGSDSSEISLTSEEGSSSKSDSNSQGDEEENEEASRKHVDMTQSVPPAKAPKGGSAGNGNTHASTKSDSAARRPRKGETSKNNQAWVVDPDFRLRFQERRKKEEAGYKLKTAATTATVSTTALSVAEHKTGKSKGRGRNVYVVDDIAPLKFTDPVPELFTNETIRTEGVPVVTGPNRLMEKENDKTATLVRTKSQLTLLIEDARRADEPQPPASQPLNNVSQAESSSKPDSELGNTDDGFEDVDEEEEQEGSSVDVSKKKNLPKIKAKRRHRPRVKR